jgi:hypothetical protein
VDSSGGFWGASRHALTVGFVSTMILAVGQRILPAFAGMRLLWSSRLMFVGLFLLTVGCGLRVTWRHVCRKYKRSRQNDPFVRTGTRALE